MSLNGAANASGVALGDARATAQPGGQSIRATFAALQRIVDALGRDLVATSVNADALPARHAGEAVMALCACSNHAEHATTAHPARHDASCR